MWENILYLFPNLGIWTIRQDGIWGTNGKGNIGVTCLYRGKLINPPRLLFLLRGARTHLFKLKVTWQAGCVQQLLDSGHLSHLFFFQKDLEGVGTLRCFLSRSKKKENISNSKFTQSNRTGYLTLHGSGSYLSLSSGSMHSTFWNRTVMNSSGSAVKQSH